MLKFLGKKVPTTILSVCDLQRGYLHISRKRAHFYKVGQIRKAIDCLGRSHGVRMKIVSVVKNHSKTKSRIEFVLIEENLRCVDANCVHV